MTSTFGHIHSIQWLRGLAALMVVIHHLGLYLTEKNMPLFSFHAGAMGVDLFFVISGFIIVYVTRNHAGNWPDTQQYFRRRLARIFPMYWLITLLYLSFPQFVDVHQVGWEKIIRSMLLLPMYWLNNWVNPFVIQGWTLYYELFFYILFGLSLWAFKPGKATIAISVAFIFLIIAGWAKPIQNPFFSCYSSPLLLEFLLGNLIAHAYLSGIRLSQLQATGLIFFGILLLPLLKHGFVDPLPYTAMPPYVRVIAWGIPAALIIAGAIFLEHATQHKNIWRNKIAELYGNWSYSLYLVHYAVFVLASLPALIIWAKPERLHQAILAIIFLCIATLVAAACFRWVELPIQRRFR